MSAPPLGHAASRVPLPDSTSRVSVLAKCAILGGQNNSNNCKEVIIRKYYAVSKYEGILKPSNDAVPISCGPEFFELAIKAGNNILTSRIYPYNVIVADDRPIVQIDKKEHSIIIKELRVFDDRQNVVVHIQDNRFWVLRDSRLERPDSSTLVVYDHNDDQVLRIRYSNPHVISLEGIFRNNQLTVTLAPDYIQIDKFYLTKDCLIGTLILTADGVSLGNVPVK